MSTENTPKPNAKIQFKSTATMVVGHGVAGFIAGPLSAFLAPYTFIMACLSHTTLPDADDDHLEIMKKQDALNEKSHAYRNLTIGLVLNFITGVILSAVLNENQTNREFWINYSLYTATIGGLVGAGYGLYKSGIHSPTDLKNLLDAHFSNKDAKSILIDADLFRANLPGMSHDDLNDFLDVLREHGFEITMDKSGGWKGKNLAGGDKSPELTLPE